jgi:hypothetical protein
MRTCVVIANWCALAVIHEQTHCCGCVEVGVLLRAYMHANQQLHQSVSRQSLNHHVDDVNMCGV